MTTTHATRPIDRVLALIATRSYPRGYHAHCPAHQDRNDSLMIWEDESDGHVGLKCWAGCPHAAICEALGIAKADLYVNNGTYRPKQKPRKLDLIDLALHKLIHPNFLLSLGLEDGYTWHTSKENTVRNVVRIPYYRADGTEYTRARIRTALVATSGSYWEGPETDPIIPYGLHRLDQARSTGSLLIVEGESDCWTCWLHGVPAMGIPSAEGAASSITDELLPHLNGISTIYISQEFTDKAGKKFPSKVTQQLQKIGYAGKSYAVPLMTTHEVKDPNALHQKLHAENRVNAFREELQCAFDAAIPIHTTSQEQENTATFENVQARVLDAIEKEDIEALFALATNIASLDTRSQESLKASIKSGMQKVSGWSWMGFKKVLDEAQKKYKKAAREERIKVTNKPEIILGRQLSEETDDILDALYKANYPPEIFVQGGHPVAVRIDEKHRPCIEILDEHLMLARIARGADFLSYNEKADDYKNTHPTRLHARQVLAQKEWRFPALAGITEIPVIRTNGTILNEPGYDEISRLFYIPQHDLDIPKIPTYPTEEQVNQACEYAFGFIQEFPYAKQADRANAYGAMLTLVTRILYALVPLALLNATKQGTGKTLFFKVIALLATGRTAATIPMPWNDEEWGKVLTSILLENTTAVFCIDNVEAQRRARQDDMGEKPLSSGVFASFLTSNVWKNRLLGSNKMPGLDQLSIPMVTGNNILLGGDLPRRCYSINMDTGISTPWQRDEFTYTPLLDHISANRGKIIAALLTIVRGWYVAGQPKAKQKVSFQDDFSGWARIISGILSFVGIEGFLANNNQLYEEADIEGTAWAIFLEAWYERYPEQAMTTSELKQELDAHPEFAALLPEELQNLYQLQVKNFNQVLGKQLRRRIGTPFGKQNLRIKRDKDTHANQQKWRVVAGNAKNSEQHSRKDEDTTSESSTSDSNGNEFTENCGSGGSTSQTQYFDFDFFSAKEEEAEKKKKSENENRTAGKYSRHSRKDEDTDTTSESSTSDSNGNSSFCGSADSRDEWKKTLDELFDIPKE